MEGNDSKGNNMKRKKSRVKEKRKKKRGQIACDLPDACGIAAWEGVTLNTSSPQTPSISVWQPPSPTATSDLYIIVASL